MAAPRSASKGVPSGAPGALLQSDLRKQLGGTTRELQAAWAHIQDLEERCRQAEADKVRAEIYSRRLEEKLERSGKGVALLRAAKLTSEVEALARENERLRGAIEGRDEEVAHMQRVLQQVAPGTGFDGAAALSEYYHLKALAPRLQHDLELKDARLQQLGAELAALRPLKATAAQLTARVADLEKQLAGSEEDKDALLEYVSELQETQAALDATAREAVSSCEMATQELESLRGELAAAAKINDELVASAAEARCAAEAVQADATEAPELRRQLADYQERFEEARRELVNVEAHVLHLGTEVAVLRSEKAQAQSLVGETMAQFKAAQAAATQAAAELSAARAELTAQASQSEAKARALGTENELLAAESCTAAELLQKTTGEAAQLRQALADASCALETERVEHHRQVLGLEQRVAELADELATAQEALAARAEQLAAAHAEVGQVRAHERDAARLAVAQHRTALEASVADNKELRASLAEAQAALKQARQETEVARSDWRRETAELESTLVAARTAAEMREVEAAALSTRLNIAKADSAVLAGRVTELQGALAAAELEARSAARSSSELQRSLDARSMASLVSENRAVREASELRQQLAEMQASQASLQEELSQASGLLEGVSSTDELKQAKALLASIRRTSASMSPTASSSASVRRSANGVAAAAAVTAAAAPSPTSSNAAPSSQQGALPAAGSGESPRGSQPPQAAASMSPAASPDDATARTAIAAATSN